MAGSLLFLVCESSESLLLSFKRKRLLAACYLMLTERKCNEHFGFQLLGTNYISFTHQMLRRCKSLLNCTALEFYVLSAWYCQIFKTICICLVRTQHHSFVSQVYNIQFFKKDLVVEVIFMLEIFINTIHYFQIKCERNSNFRNWHHKCL